MRISHVDHFSYFVLVMKENLWILRTSLKDYFSSILYFRERGILDFPKISFFFLKRGMVMHGYSYDPRRRYKIERIKGTIFFLLRIIHHYFFSITFLLFIQTTKQKQKQKSIKTHPNRNQKPIENRTPNKNYKF